MKTITISGIIGWDTDAVEFREALQRANGEDVEIVINSPGGLVSDALEMYNLIRNYAGETLVKLSGYAMSAASYIPLAANRVVAEDNAIYMIHNVIGGVYGNHNEIIKYGEIVRSMSKMLGKAYSVRSGKSTEEIEQLMDAESYFFGDEMVEAGFVDEIIATETEPDKETAMTGALVAFKALESKLGKEAEAVKDDITRAAAVADSVFKNRAAATATPATEGVQIMNVEQLKSEHPDLVAAVVAEAREGMVTAEEMQASIDTAKTEGAAAECQRITDVRAQSIPGHEDLVEKMAFDGKSTGADTAMAIVAAEKVRIETAAADLEADANDPAPPSDGESNTDGRKMSRKDFNNLSDSDRRSFLTDGGKIVD